MTWLWHDDVRTPPSDRWAWAKTNAEAIDILKVCTVEAASLDHDLGCIPAEGNTQGWDDPDEVFLPPKGWRFEDGTELCKWMVEHQKFPTLEVIFHSWNPAGAERMRDILKEGGCLAVLTIMPYSKANYRGL